MPIATSCAGLILAAGFSRRFGADKRLQPLADGTPLGLRTAQQWLNANALDQIYVVTRPDDDFSHVLRQAAPRCTLLCAVDAELGMGHSLSNAIAQIKPAGNRCLLIGLADMPRVLPTTLNTLARDLMNRSQRLPHCIVAPRHKGRPGNPVGFGPAWRGALKACRNDEGARSIVRAGRESGAMHYVDTSDPGVLQDVDTNKQLQAI